MNLLFARVMSGMLAFDASKLDPKFQWVAYVVDAINVVVWPLLIVVAAAGTIYAIVLGVNMARADSTEKREEAKKRVINVIIGMIIIVALILLLQLFVNTILPSFIGAPQGE